MLKRVAVGWAVSRVRLLSVVITELMLLLESVSASVRALSLPGSVRCGLGWPTGLSACLTMYMVVVVLHDAKNSNIGKANGLKNFMRFKLLVGYKKISESRKIHFRLNSLLFGKILIPLLWNTNRYYSLGTFLDK